MGKQEVSDRINELNDAEAAYIGRWLAIKHPEIAEEGLAALAQFKLDYPGPAKTIGMEV